MKSYAFLFWGSMVVWAALAAYLGWLGVRLHRLARRLDRLEREGGAPEPPRPAGGPEGSAPAPR